MATKELNSGDVSPRQKADINLDLSTDLTKVRQNENIIIDDAPIDNDYFNELAFMEEKLTIRLERTNEKHAPSMVDISVNGRTEWLEVGKPIIIARKYVEVLARCKSDSITTIAPNADGQEVVNRLTRNSSQKHPFSVIHDPSQRGYEWLTKILSQ